MFNSTKRRTLETTSDISESTYFHPSQRYLQYPVPDAPTCICGKTESVGKTNSIGETQSIHVLTDGAGESSVQQRLLAARLEGGT